MRAINGFISGRLGSIIIEKYILYGGHNADNYNYDYDYGGHPAPAGRALPNLINAVSILKSKSKTPLCPYVECIIF
jgi:hypothetical protein